MAITTLHKNFGRHIQRLRKAQGITQEDLAHLIEVDRSYMGFIERGERNPTLSKIHKISQVLNVSLCKLFEFEYE